MSNKTNQPNAEATRAKALLQKRNALVEMILTNALHSRAAVRLSPDGEPSFLGAAKAAVEAADFLMEECYFVKMKPSENEK